MVEVLRRRPVEKHKDPELMRQDPKRVFSGYTMFSVQREIIQTGRFTSLDKSTIVDFKLSPGTVIKSLEHLLTNQKAPTKTINHANEIVKKGWVPSQQQTGDGSYRQQLRRSALKTLLTLCESERARIRKDHQNNQIPDNKLRSLLEPIEGTRLAALSELNHKKH